jgi:hypothetical protein
MGSDQQIAQLPFLTALDHHKQQVDRILQAHVGFHFCYLF